MISYLTKNQIYNKFLLFGVTIDFLCQTLPTCCMSKSKNGMYKQKLTNTSITSYSRLKQIANIYLQSVQQVLSLLCALCRLPLSLSFKQMHMIDRCKDRDSRCNTQEKDNTQMVCLCLVSQLVEQTIVCLHRLCFFPRRTTCLSLEIIRYLINGFLPVKYFKMKEVIWQKLICIKSQSSFIQVSSC